MAELKEPGGLYHVALLRDCLRYITHNGTGDPTLASRVRWAIDIEKQRYEDDKAALNAGAPPSDGGQR